MNELTLSNCALDCNILRDFELLFNGMKGNAAYIVFKTFCTDSTVTLTKGHLSLVFGFISRFARFTHKEFSLQQKLARLFSIALKRGGNKYLHQDAIMICDQEFCFLNPLAALMLQSDVGTLVLLNLCDESVLQLDRVMSLMLTPRYGFSAQISDRSPLILALEHRCVSPKLIDALIQRMSIMTLNQSVFIQEVLLCAMKTSLRDNNLSTIHHLFFLMTEIENDKVIHLTNALKIAIIEWLSTTRQDFTTQLCDSKLSRSHAVAKNETTCSLLDIIQCEFNATCDVVDYKRKLYQQQVLESNGTCSGVLPITDLRLVVFDYVLYIKH